MSDRRRWLIVAGIGAVLVIAAVGAYLLSDRSDATLARWSEVGGVISAVATVLALVAAAIPLWRPNDRKDSTTKEGGQAPQVAGTTVTQQITAANVVGHGSQQIINVNLTDADRPDAGGR